MSRRWAVVTNCTEDKLDRAAPARELYRGPSVRRIAEAVDIARARGVDVELYIISAKYGLVHERQVIEPYDETLVGKPTPWVRAWARRVGLLDALERVARQRTVALTASYMYYVAVEELACRHKFYVLSPYRPRCGTWVKTGNFDKHIALKKLLLQEQNIY